MKQPDYGRIAAQLVLKRVIRFEGHWVSLKLTDEDTGPPLWYFPVTHCYSIHIPRDTPRSSMSALVAESLETLHNNLALQRRMNEHGYLISDV